MIDTIPKPPRFVPAFLKLAPYTTISLILTDNLARTLGYRPPTVWNGA